MKSKYGYMDYIDFAYEIGDALGGNTIYPSIDDLCKHRKCVRQCGIVRVKITLEKVLAPHIPSHKRTRTIEEVKKVAKENDK